MNHRDNLRSINPLPPPPLSTWCRSVDPILVKIQLLWLLDFRLGFVFVIFVLFLVYIWFKLSLVTRFAGMLVTPLAMCFAMLSCRSAQHLGRLVFFYIIICLLFYQFTNFNTLLDVKIRRIKIIFPVTSLVVIHRDTTWKMFGDHQRSHVTIFCVIFYEVQPAFKLKRTTKCSFV